MYIVFSNTGNTMLIFKFGKLSMESYNPQTFFKKFNFFNLIKGIMFFDSQFQIAQFILSHFDTLTWSLKINRMKAILHLIKFCYYSVNFQIRVHQKSKVMMQ